MVHAAWKNKDSHPYEAMLNSVSGTDFPRVLAASLSAYVPQKAYEETCNDLLAINRELTILHQSMLSREEERKSPNFINYTFSTAFEEASVICVLEHHYGYTEHGSSVGGCWLEDFYKGEESPKFVLKK